MSFSAVCQQLRENYRSVVNEVLPGGSWRGDRYEVGGLDGSKGRSLSVQSYGRFVDFEGGEQGDMMDLVMMQLQLDKEGACRWAEERFGPVTTREKKFQAAGSKKKTPVTPPPRSPASPNLHAYLEGRGIPNPESVVQAWGVYETCTSRGADIVFPAQGATGDIEYIKFKPLNYDGQKASTQKGLGADQQIAIGWQAVGAQARSLWITEGEEDAISLWSCGFDAVSLPSGAGSEKNMLANDYEKFLAFERLYVATDMDEPGERSAQKIIESLDGEDCQVFRIRLPEKDANDVLKKHGAAKAKEIFEGAKETAKNTLPPTLIGAESVEEEVFNELAGLNEDTGFGFGWNRTDSVDFSFDEGRLYTFAGPNGSGKSMFTSQVVCNAILKSKKKALIASFEMLPKDTMKRIYQQICGTRTPTREYLRAASEKFLRGQLFLYRQEGNRIKVTIEEVLRDCEYAYRRYGINLFVLDSLTNLAALDSEGMRQQSDVVERLNNFKLKYPVTIFLVAHTRKTDGHSRSLGKDDVKGSSVITDLADGVFLFERNQKKADAKSKEELFGEAMPEEIAKLWDTTCSCVKNRHGSFHGSFGFNVHEKSLQFVARDNRLLKYFEWSS